MTSQPYPWGVDCVWTASDRDGHIGAFVTAGLGPVPVVTLDNADALLVRNLEDEILKLPKVSDCRLLVSVGQTDSFTELAERGLFVYDWSDVHRSVIESLHSYEPIAVPLKPISLDGLSGVLKSCARSVKFETVAFADGKLLNVSVHLKCSGGQ